LSQQPVVDMVVLDQQLMMPSVSRSVVQGTDVAAELRSKGYRGVVVISSSDSADHLPPGDYVTVRSFSFLLLSQKITIG
jgi:hypothetical protein